MPEFVDWKTTADPWAVLSQAVDAIRRGETVALPSETGYAAARLASEAAPVRAIAAADAEWSLALPRPTEISDWVADLGPVALRFARRCWPGPIRMLLEGRLNPEKLALLSEPVRERDVQGQTLATR